LAGDAQSVSDPLPRPALFPGQRDVVRFNPLSEAMERQRGAKPNRRVIRRETQIEFSEVHACQFILTGDNVSTQTDTTVRHSGGATGGWVMEALQTAYRQLDSSGMHEAACGNETRRLTTPPRRSALRDDALDVSALCPSAFEAQVRRGQFRHRTGAPRACSLTSVDGLR